MTQTQSRAGKGRALHKIIVLNCIVEYKMGELDEQE